MACEPQGPERQVRSADWPIHGGGDTSDQVLDGDVFLISDQVGSAVSHAFVCHSFKRVHEVVDVKRMVKGFSGAKDGETAFQKKIKFTKVPIEAAMKLPNGREVRDLPSLKVALMADKERILKGIIGKLISYAHGREITLADRPHIDEVYTSVAQNDFSLRATIHAIVAHPAFGKK